MPGVTMSLSPGKSAAALQGAGASAMQGAQTFMMAKTITNLMKMGGPAPAPTMGVSLARPGVSLARPTAMQPPTPKGAGGYSN